MENPLLARSDWEIFGCALKNARLCKTIARPTDDTNRLGWGERSKPRGDSASSQLTAGALLRRSGDTEEKANELYGSQR